MNVIYLYLSKKKTLTEPFCRRDVNFNFNLRRIITFRNLVQSYFVSSFKPVLHFNTFSKNVRRSSRIGIFCRPPSAFPSPPYPYAGGVWISRFFHDFAPLFCPYFISIGKIYQTIEACFTTFSKT